MTVSEIVQVLTDMRNAGMLDEIEEVKLALDKLYMDSYHERRLRRAENSGDDPRHQMGRQI